MLLVCIVYPFSFVFALLFPAAYLANKNIYTISCANIRMERQTTVFGTLLSFLARIIRLSSLTIIQSVIEQHRIVILIEHPCTVATAACPLAQAP